MRAIQVGSALAVLAASLFLTIVAIIDGRYLSGAAWMIGCLAIEACIFDVSRPWKDDRWLFGGLAGGAALLTVFSALFSSAATDSRRQDAQLDLMAFYIDVQGGIYEQANPAARRLAERGMALCAVQRYVDLADLANELHKAQHLGPTPSLILGSYEQMVGEDRPVASCIGSFIELNRIAPDLAKVFLRKHPEVLTYK